MESSVRLLSVTETNQRLADHGLSMLIELQSVLFPNAQHIPEYHHKFSEKEIMDYILLKKAAVQVIEVPND